MDLSWIAVRRGAAAALAVCFFLPIANCPRVERTGTTISNHGSGDIAPYSAYDWPSIGAAVTLVAFVWPIAFELGRLFQRRRATLSLVASLVMSGLSAALVAWIVMWSRSIRYGAFVAYAAIAGYIVAIVASYRARTPGRDDRS